MAVFVVTYIMRDDYVRLIATKSVTITMALSHDPMPLLQKPWPPGHFTLVSAPLLSSSFLLFFSSFLLIFCLVLSLVLSFSISSKSDARRLLEVSASAINGSRVLVSKRIPHSEEARLQRHLLRLTFLLLRIWLVHTVYQRSARRSQLSQVVSLDLSWCRSCSCFRRWLDPHPHVAQHYSLRPPEIELALPCR